MESRATESRPPERPSARCAPGKILGTSVAATLSGNSLDLEFLELPIAHQALEALLDEFLGALVGKTAQSVGERFLQALGHRGRIAVRAAQRFVDDPVDQTEGLQTAGGDAERFRCLRRPVGALPQDRSVAFRPGHAEVSEDLLLGIASLLMPDHDHRLAVETGKASDDRGIVGKRAVPVKFLEIGKQGRGVIERVGTLRMPRHLSDLPRRELSVDLLGKRGALFLQALDFLGDVGRRVVLREAQLLDFRLQLGDRLLEIEKRRLHGEISKKQAILPESPEPPVGGSILDWNRIEAAPKIPGCDRAPRLPDRRDLAHRPKRYRPPSKVIPTDGALQPQIVQRQHIGAQQAENQEHFRSPAADATNLDELGDHRLVLHVGPGRDVQAPADKMGREPAEILGLAPGQAAADQLRVSRVGDLPRKHSRRDRDDTCPDARGGFDRNLLAHDRAGQGEKRLAARLERDARMTADDLREHWITACKRAFGPDPVGRGGRSHEDQARKASGRLRSRFCGFMRTPLFSSIDKAMYTGLPARSARIAAGSSKSSRNRASMRLSAPGSISSPRHSPLSIAVDSESRPICQAQAWSSTARSGRMLTLTPKKCRIHFSITRQNALFAARPTFMLITKSWH